MMPMQLSGGEVVSHIRAARALRARARRRLALLAAEGVGLLLLVLMVVRSAGG